MRVGNETEKDSGRAEKYPSVSERVYESLWFDLDKEGATSNGKILH
jgi:hypothetical protein